MLIINIKLSVFILINIAPLSIYASDSQWNNKKNQNWPSGFSEVEIVSSADGKIQKAYFYATRSKEAKPLIVSLHGWSVNYQREDQLIPQILERDYNFIRPDFRGTNNTKEACGSPLVISDIEDAISYAIKNGNVDTNNIHILGTSGGGHATLLAYMKSDHNVRSFSAWVPISDIAKWYNESIGRNQKYAIEISLVTTGDSTGIDIQEARRRSPIYMDTPVEKRKNSKLYIYAGIHDGYKGPVPITHSLDFYNKVVKDYEPRFSEHLIHEETIKELVVSRNYKSLNKATLSGRDVYYSRHFRDLIEIYIFEGAHEMIVEHALKHIPH
jgi:dienelactone hydrolase